MEIKKERIEPEIPQAIPQEQEISTSTEIIKIIKVEPFNCF